MFPPIVLRLGLGNPLLANVDANRGYGAVACFAVHGACSSGLVAPANCGQEHGRSIPLGDIIGIEAT
jgi:hypothetical protein